MAPLGDQMGTGQDDDDDDNDDNNDDDDGEAASMAHATALPSNCWGVTEWIKCSRLNHLF